jgi:hypothetical protein
MDTDNVVMVKAGLNAHWPPESPYHFALDALVAERDRLRAALKNLVEQVECDESVGICLSDRVAALNAFQLLSEKP